MMNFMMRASLATAMAGAIATQQDALFGSGADVHPGPKFIRVNADGTSEEVPHMSSRFVKARVQEMAAAGETPVEDKEEAHEDGAFLKGSEPVHSQAVLVKGLMEIGLPEQAAVILAQSSPDMAQQLVGDGVQAAPEMGCRLKVGERVCM